MRLIKPVTINNNLFPGDKSIFVIDYYRAKDKQLNELIDLFNTEYIPLFNKWNINASLWVSEMEENDFPRLTVYQDENLLVVITSCNTELEYESILDKFQTSDKESMIRLNELLQYKTSLVLYPTGN